MTQEQEGLPFDVMLGLNPERRFDKTELTEIAYRPTLIIGIGGTGQRVVPRLKTRLRGFFEEDQQRVFQCLVLDTDTQEPAEADELSPGEFVYLGNIDGNGIVDHLAIHDYIRPWWPQGYRPGFISKGAKAVRCVGRLALFHYIDEIIVRLQDAISQAIDVNASMGLQSRSAKVYVVASLCGGTGSGMFLDMAYIARDLFMQRVPVTYVTGLLVMPDAFEPLFTSLSTTNRARANTYAACKTLDHHMYHRDFPMRYSDTYAISLPSGQRPFDICYLLGSTNENHQNVGNISDLGEMMAEEIFLEIASPLGGKEASQLDNIDEVNNISLGKPMAYSSFAVGSLAYPVSEITTWCAARDTARLTQGLLLQPLASGSDAEESAEAFLRQQRIREQGVDEVLDQLNQSSRGSPISIQAQFIEVEGFKRDETLDVIRDLEAYTQEELVKLQEQMDANLDRLRQRARAALGREVKQLTLGPRYGVTFGQWFLGHLRAKVRAQRDEEMVAEAKEWKERKQAQLAVWRDARQELEAAVAPGGILGIRSLFGRGVTPALRDCISAYNGYLDAWRQLELRSRAITFYESLKESIDDLDRRLNSLKAKLNATRERTQLFTERALVGKRILQGEYVLARSAVGFERLRQLYERYSPSLETEEDKRRVLSEFLNYVLTNDPDWSPLAHAEDPEDQIGERLYNFLRAHFEERLGAMNLLELLEEMGDSAQVGHEVLTVFGQAGPFWNYTTVDCPEGRGNIHPVNLVGYDGLGGDDSRWADRLSAAIPDRFTPVTTNDGRQLVVLRTKHGLPLYTFKGLRGPYRNAYEVYEDQWRSQREGARPLHASELWEKTVADLHPSRLEYSRMLFAIGFALDLVYQSGDKSSWYYARARHKETEPFREDHQLANGLEEAIETFIIMKEARQDVDQELREMMVSAQADTLRRLRDFLPRFEELAAGSPTNKDVYHQMRAWVEQFVREYRRVL
jgi:hypothetical protein